MLIEWKVIDVGNESDTNDGSREIAAYSKTDGFVMFMRTFNEYALEILMKHSTNVAVGLLIHTIVENDA